MLNKLKQQKESGFTIIEVMIVLAIAGLMMVVVFLAVPALQRNSRNSSVASSVNNALSAVATYSTNNGGGLPASASFTTPNLTVGVASTNQEKISLDAGVAALTYVKDAAVATAITTTATTGTVQILTGVNANCNDTKTGLGTAGAASSRSVIALYVAESGNGKILKCVES